MALVPKKTYSRRNNELSVLSDKEKENVDPFDELLSSPLKQDVQFQPLSFWGEKVKHLESKGKSRKVDCGLFQTSDSDEFNSPCRRKRKPNSNTESKARTLQPKTRSLKLNDRRKNYSAYSCNREAKVIAPVMSNRNKTFASTQEVEKHKACFLERNIYPKETTEERLYSPNKSRDTFTNVKCHLRKAKSVTCSSGNFNCSSSSVRSKGNLKKKLNKPSDETYIINSNSVGFKIYEDISTSEQQPSGAACETVIVSCRNDSIGSTSKDSINMDEIPFRSGHHNFKFVNVRRHFQYPDYFNVSHDNFNASCSSVDNNNSNRCPVPLWNVPKKSISAINLKLDDNGQAKFLEKIDDESLNHCDDSSVNSLSYNDSMDKTLCNGDYLSEESREMSRLECQGENTFSGGFDLISLSETELVDLIQEIHIANLLNGVASESSSDDTLSSFNDEETVINVRLKAEADNSPLASFCVKNPDTQSVLNGVSVLTTKVSDLSISNATGCDLSMPEVKKMGNHQHFSNYEDKGNSFSFDLKNITTKRRGQSSGLERNSFNEPSSVSPKEERIEKQTHEDMECDQTMWTPSRMSIDWNKTICFANPAFESTRVLDMGLPDTKKQTDVFDNSDSILEETLSGLDRTYALKPGKKWQRSLSVLKQIQRGSIAGDRLESTRITGRKFESFLREMLEIEKSGFFTSLADNTVSNKTVIGASDKSAHLSRLGATVLESGSSSQKKPEKFNIEDSVFSKSLPNETLNESTSFNHTVKVIQPEETPSAFRSALGLDGDCSLLKEASDGEKSSAISARDFILLQCGQEDVLPFEDYFNERTLENCRKIGEGVYGEVFMCSNAVIKIIPIEGSDKVNGEPQKTFEEIISEVVIASKLSNLRKGEEHRTDGFSEMKRCWCVKGKYPKYLLKLWNDYDQLGSGSENDSPVMFKDDQLYIILELGNGGKDLESFVFSSSAQSLSIFIQTAFSLAVAEKAFEFEHRDLHWGNVLISETKDKFMSVLLDGTEYKIPTKGVKVCIIDFTLSRVNHEGCCIFNDLSVDPGLFASEGDYQFEIYRLMLREVRNDWSLFRPKTNIFWLHYTLDKMLKMVRYKNKKAKVHTKHLKDIKTLECAILEYKDSADFVLSDSLNDVMKKL